MEATLGSYVAGERSRGATGSGKRAEGTPPGRRGLWRLGCSVFSPAARPARISAMLIAIMAMSMADLYMTLTHLLNFGMAEANPLARRIMEQGSAAELITWKLVTVLIAVVLLFWARKRRSAEIGTVICFFILVWLTAHWANYNRIVSALTPEMHMLAILEEEGRWVTFVGRE